MKKLILLAPIVVILAACSSSPKDPYERRAYQDEQRKEKAAEQAIDRAPKWMTDLPVSKSAVYQNGTAVSPDYSMAVTKAKTVAFGKICMSAGGRVNQQSKIYRTDSENASTEFSELAIKTYCPGVDISGVEVAAEGIKVIPENGRFRAYVLIALPIGEANGIQKVTDARNQRRLAETRSRESFKELDRAETQKPQ
jgi:hypothetical protein